MCPLVVFGVAGAHFAGPVEAEADFVELLTVAVDVFLGGHGRVLPCLYGVLLGGEAVGVVAHGVQDVEAVEAFEAGVDVGGDVAEGVPDVEACSGGVGEHVEDVVFGLVEVDVDFVGFVVDPVFLPAAFYVSEVVVLCHSKSLR